MYSIKSELNICRLIKRTNFTLINLNRNYHEKDIVFISHRGI